MANRKEVTADLGFGSKADFYANVVDVELAVAGKSATLNNAIRNCGFNLGKRNVTQLRFNVDGNNGLTATATDFLGKSETLFIPTNAPDAVTKRLVRMLAELGFDHNKFYVLHFELQGDILTVSSKPK